MRLARELGKSIAEVEAFDGSEKDAWRHHFDKYPFTIDMADMIGAHIVQAIVMMFGGKRHRLEKFLLIKRAKSKEKQAEELRAALG